MLFQTPETNTINTCTITKTTSMDAAMKWIVRADWRPPKIVRNSGDAASRRGDIARPGRSVQAWRHRQASKHQYGQEDEHQDQIRRLLEDNVPGCFLHGRDALS